MFLALLFSTIAWASSPVETVNYVDLNQYTGKWFEIARYDQSFQKGCINVTAEYSLKKNGEVLVKNSCTKEGKVKSSTARAWVKDEQTNAKLKVQFFLKFLKLPFFAGDYWIISLGEDYQYAVVSDPEKKTLWILNREAKMDPAQLDMILDDLELRGYDTKKLIYTQKI